MRQPSFAGGSALLLEPDLPQVARQQRAEIDPAARRERGAPGGDRLRVAVGRAAPHAALRVLARDRAGPPVADHVATLEVILLRRHRAVLDALLAPLLAPAG